MNQTKWLVSFGGSTDRTITVEFVRADTPLEAIELATSRLRGNRNSLSPNIRVVRAMVAEDQS